MSIFAWIILGLIAGFIGSKIVNHSGEGIIRDILLGIVGAVLGGWLFTAFGASGVDGLNLYSLLVAVVGSVFISCRISRTISPSRVGRWILGPVRGFKAAGRAHYGLCTLF